MPSGVSVPGQAQGTNQPSPPTGVVTATNEVKLIVQANQFIPFPNFAPGTWPTFLDAFIANKAKNFIETFLTRFTGRLKTGSPPRAKFEWIFAPGGQDLEMWIPTDLVTDPNPTLANHLEVKRYKIISRVRDLVLEATQGRSVVCTGGDAMGSIKLATSTGTFSGFKGSSAGLLWTLPATDGTDGQFIKTDGGGSLSFDDAFGVWQILADAGIGASDVEADMIVAILGGTALTSTLADRGGGTGFDVTLALDDTAVLPGSYSRADITVDQQGRITYADNGAVKAPVDAEYVVLSLNGDLTNERVLTAGTGITITDNGAGGTVIITADHDEYVGWGVYGDNGPTGAYVRSDEYVDFTGGNIITTTLSEAGGLDGYFLTIDHDTSAVTAGSYTNTDLTVDAYGHITAASNGSTSGGMVEWDLAADTGTNMNVTNAVTVLLTGGTFIDTANSSFSCTIDLSATGTASSGTFLRGDNYWAPLTDLADADESYVVISASGDLSAERVLTAGSGITITDGGANSTVTIAATGGSGTVTSITPGADTGIGTAITTSGTITVAGGTNVATSVTGTTITVNASDAYVGTVTSVATSNGTFVNVSGGTITTTGTITAELSATGTANSGKFLRGDNTWADLTSMADADESYVVISASGNLTAERVLTAGSGISITDGGANSTVTIAATGGGSGTVTSVATSNGTFVNITGGTITTTGTITGDLSATGTANSGKFLRGDNTWADLTSMADADESYVVMALSGDLTNERKLTAGTNITITDGGAGGNVTIAASGGGGGGMSSWTAKPDVGDDVTVDSTNSDLYITSSDSTVIVTGNDGTDTIDLTLAGTGNVLEFWSSSDSLPVYGDAIIGTGNGGLEFSCANSQSDSEDEFTKFLHFTVGGDAQSMINCSVGRYVGTQLAISATASGASSGDGSTYFGGDFFGGTAGAITLIAGDSIKLTCDGNDGDIEIGHIYRGYSGTYGNTTNIPQVQVDDWGHVTGIADIPITYKSAVVKSSDPDPDAFVELYCTESPEVRFEDVLVIEPPAQCLTFTHPIDPEFLHVCESESIKPIGYTTSSPAIAGLQVHGDELRVEFSDLLPVPDELVVHLSGIRVGHKGRRFGKVDAARAEANDRFWSTPLVPTKRPAQG